MSEILVLQVAAIAGGTIVAVASLRFLRRMMELRHERTGHAPPPEVMQRLEQIEMALEVTAGDVERLAEANRFLATLLAERNDSAADQPRSPARVITPH